MAAPGLSAGGAAGTRLVPLVLAVALFMEQLDSTVIATALPAIAADIGTSPVSLKLAVTTYLVALGCARDNQRRAVSAARRPTFS